MSKLLWIIAVIVLVVIVVVTALMLRRRGYAALSGVSGGAEDEAYLDGYVDGGGVSIRMREPWFQAVLDKKKTAEARLNRPPFAKLKAGDSVVIARSRPEGDTTEYPGPRRVKATIRSAKKYAGLAELLEGEPLGDLLPGTKTKAAGLKVFREFISEDAEKEGGVLALGFELDE